MTETCIKERERDNSKGKQPLTVSLKMRPSVICQYWSLYLSISFYLEMQQNNLCVFTSPTYQKLVHLNIKLNAEVLGLIHVCEADPWCFVCSYDFMLDLLCLSFIVLNVLICHLCLLSFSLSLLLFCYAPSHSL